MIAFLSMPVLAALPDRVTSFIVLLVLIAIFLVSWVMFWILAQRSTSMRQSVATLEWGRDHGLKPREFHDAPPEPLTDLGTRGIRTTLCLWSEARMFLRLSGPAPGATEANPAEMIWNLYVQKLSASWPPTGLRPTKLSSSVLDLFSLTSFPLLGPTDRFVVYGTDAPPARVLSRSAARGLLPPDIGLILAGAYLVLDFSARPFDEVEFNRAMAIADQIAKHLPQPG